VGVLPLERVLDRPHERWEETSVGDVMLGTGEVPCLPADEPALDGLSDLLESDLRRGLLVEDGRVTGFVSVSDIARLVGRRGARTR